MQFSPLFLGRNASPPPPLTAPPNHCLGPATGTPPDEDTPGVFLFNMFDMFPLCECFGCKKAFTQTHSLCAVCTSMKVVKAEKLCPTINLPFQAFFDGIISELRWRLRKPVPKRDLRTTIKPFTIGMFAALWNRFNRTHGLTAPLQAIIPPGPRTRKSPFHWTFQLKKGPEDLGAVLWDAFLPESPTPIQYLNTYASGRLYDNGVWVYACVPATFTIFAKDRMGNKETKLVIKVDTICLTSTGQWTLPPPAEHFPNRVALCKMSAFCLLKLHSARQQWNATQPAGAPTVPAIPTPMLQAAAMAVQADEEE